MVTRWETIRTLLNQFRTSESPDSIAPRDTEAKREAEPSVAELIARLLKEYVPDHCKPSTQQEYGRSVKFFIDPVIGEMRVSEVQRKDIAACITA